MFMFSKPFRGNDRFTQGLGYVYKANDALLGSPAWVAKKSAVLDYDFSGYRSFGLLGQSAKLGIIPKNTLFGRLSASPYLYRPLILVKITAAPSQSDVTVATVDMLKLINRSEVNHQWALTVQTGEFVRIWDNSAQAFMGGTNDRNRYISAVDFTTGILTLNGALTGIVETNADYIVVGVGIEDLVEVVLMDELVDLREDAKPKVISRNLPIGLIYSARLNTKYIGMWWKFPVSFRNELKDKCQRLIFDYQD